MKKPFNFMVDTIHTNSLSVAKVKQFDTALFNITITENGSALDLSNTSLRFFVRKADGKLVFQDEGITIVDAKAGKIAIDVRNSAFQFVGIAVAEIDIKSNDQPIATADFYFDVEEKLGNDEAVKSVIDVDLFTKLTNYIEEALADIDKYKGLMEAFTNAGISIEGLHDIKAYIDSHLDGLKTENNKAAELIPQVNKARTDAEAKRLDVVNATNTAEEKRVEVLNATNSANASKSALEGSTKTADAKKKEVDNSTASAEAKRVELTRSIETANSSKSALEDSTESADTKKKEVISATNNAESKRVQVVDVTGKAESKRAELQKVIDAVGDCGLVTKSMLDTALSQKINKVAIRKVGTDLNTITEGGFYAIANDPPCTNLPESSDGYLLVMPCNNNKWCSQLFIEDITGRVYTRTTKTQDATAWSPWARIYTTDSKPTPDELGALGKKGQIDGKVDWNTITEAGMYKVQDALKTSPNSPTQALKDLYGFGILIVYKTSIESEDRVLQVYYPHLPGESNRIPVSRMKNGTGWTDWQRITDGVKASDTQLFRGMGIYRNFKDVGFPYIGQDGVMEVGTMIDFHPVGGKDFCPRLTAYDNGLKVSGDFFVEDGGRVVTANGSGIMGRLTDGNSDYMIYMGSDNRLKIGHNLRAIDIDSKDVGLGNFKFGQRDFLLYGKRALVGFNTPDGNKLYLNFENDFRNGIELAGNVYNNGRRMLSDIQGSPLWQGYHHMSANETVTPSKPLSQCNNGWVIVWSDWDDGTRGQDWNFCYTYIPKNTPWKGGQNHTFPLTAGENIWAIKTLYVYDTYFKGNSTNKDGNNYDVVIRAVLEY